MANLLHVQIKLAVEALVTHIVGVGELSVATELPWDGAAIKVRSVTRRGGWTRGDGGELTESSGLRLRLRLRPGLGLRLRSHLVKGIHEPLALCPMTPCGREEAVDQSEGVELDL